MATSTACIRRHGEDVGIWILWCMTGLWAWLSLLLIMHHGYVAGSALRKLTVRSPELGARSPDELPITFRRKHEAPGGPGAVSCFSRVRNLLLHFRRSSISFHSDAPTLSLHVTPHFTSVFNLPQSSIFDIPQSQSSPVSVFSSI